MRLRTLLLILAVAGLCFAADLRPAASDCPVDGAYQSDWGSVQLVQNGKSVAGTWAKGTVRGVRHGNIIRYTWYEGHMKGGKGFWQISPNCDHLTGPWGSGDNETGGGNWNLHK